MDWESIDWVTVAAVGTAIVAIWGVIVGHLANRRAKTANGHAETANGIAQSALNAQEISLPPPWGKAVPASKHVFEIENSSGRDIVVTGIDLATDPEEAFLRSHDVLPSRVEYGDALRVRVVPGWQAPPPRVVFTWYFEEEPDSVRSTERGIHAASE